MALQGWTEDDYIERLGVLKSEWTSKQTLDEVERWRKIGAKGSVRDVAESVRVRYFTDGAVLGGQRFVDEFFESKKDPSGQRRKDRGRKMRGAQWGNMRVLRDLRTDVIQ